MSSLLLVFLTGVPLVHAEKPWDPKPWEAPLARSVPMFEEKTLLSWP